MLSAASCLLAAEAFLLTMGISSEHNNGLQAERLSRKQKCSFCEFPKGGGFTKGVYKEEKRSNNRKVVLREARGV